MFHETSEDLRKTESWMLFTPQSPTLQDFLENQPTEKENLTLIYQFQEIFREKDSYNSFLGRETFFVCGIYCVYCNQSRLINNFLLH